MKRLLNSVTCIMGLVAAPSPSGKLVKCDRAPRLERRTRSQSGTPNNVGSCSHTGSGTRKAPGAQKDLDYLRTSPQNRKLNSTAREIKPIPAIYPHRSEEDRQADQAQQGHKDSENQADSSHDLEADVEPREPGRQALLQKERLCRRHAAVPDFEPPMGDPEARQNEAQQSSTNGAHRR